jgi:hypothetical protein
MNKLEVAMEALQSLVETACAALDPAPSVGELNEAIPEAIDVAVSDPAHTRIVLTDGDSDEPDALLGGDEVIYDHTGNPVIEMIAVHPDEAKRRPALTAAIDTIVAALEADPTLNGSVDWARPGVATYGRLAEVGAPPGRTAQLPIVLLYSSDSPVG